MKKISNFFLKVYKEKKLLLVSIFFLSVFASMIFLLVLRDFGPTQHQKPGSDFFVRYKPVAESFLQGEGFTKEGEILTESPPGYPIILSGVFGLSNWLKIDELQLIIFFNIVFVAFASCLLFLIGELLFNKKIGLIASFLWLGYPFNLWFIKNPNTEVPFILLLYVGIFLYILSLKKIKWEHIFLAGIVFGFSSLIRPNSILLALPLAILIFFFRKISVRKRTLLAMVLLMANLFAVFPWEAYVFYHTGEIIPLSTLGSAALTRGLTFTLEEGEGGDKTKISNGLREFMEKVEAKKFKNKTEILLFTLKEFKKDPRLFFELLWLRITRSWYATSQQWYEGLILAVQLPYLIAALGGLILAFRNYRRKIWNIILLLAVIFYFWMITLSTHAILRFMVPVMGLIIIFSAITVSFVIDKLIKRYKLSTSCQS